MVAPMAATSRAYSPEEKAAISARILARIVKPEKVSAACQAEGISWSTFWEWKAADPELAASYARASKASGTAWADKATAAVQGATISTVQLAKLRADHYAWRASRADRRGFGEFVGVELDGEGLKPSVVVLPALDAAPVPPADGLMIEETRRVVVGASAAPALKAALSEYLSRHTGGVTKTVSEGDEIRVLAP